MIAPVLSLIIPGTFSQTIHSGFKRSAIRRNSRVRLPRGSSNPSRFPASENDWQGEPPTTTSADPGWTWIVVTSPKLGTPGKRCESTAHGNGSISAKPTGSQPSGFHATDGALIPLKRHKYFNARRLRSQDRPRPFSLPALAWPGTAREN